MVVRGRQAPYTLLTSGLFNDGTAQKVGRFLGAGASISARTDSESIGAAHLPEIRFLAPPSGRARTGRTIGEPP